MFARVSICFCVFPGVSMCFPVFYVFPSNPICFRVFPCISVLLSVSMCLNVVPDVSMCFYVSPGVSMCFLVFHQICFFVFCVETHKKKETHRSTLCRLNTSSLILSYNTCCQNGVVSCQSKKVRQQKLTRVGPLYKYKVGQHKCTNFARV